MALRCRYRRVEIPLGEALKRGAKWNSTNRPQNTEDLEKLKGGLSEGEVPAQYGMVAVWTSNPLKVAPYWID